MATREIHNEIPKWKNIENLIEWKRYQYSKVFPHVYWAAGIILAILILTFQKRIIGINLQLYLLILGFLTLIFIWLILLIHKGYKTANENLEYLYRKKDGQTA